MPASHGLRITLGVFKMFIGAHLVVTNLFSALPAQGPSMLPSFAIFGEWLGTDMRCRLGRGVGVGDLVMYRIPIKRNDVGVKRIIGMPGDYVLAGTPGQPGQKTMIQVPEGHCWIAGDNLPASRDSRTFGPIPLALIEGKVVAKVLPWNQRCWLQNGLRPADD